PDPSARGPHRVPRRVSGKDGTPLSQKAVGGHDPAETGAWPTHSRVRTGVGRGSNRLLRMETMRNHSLWHHQQEAQLQVPLRTPVQTRVGDGSTRSFPRGT